MKCGITFDESLNKMKSFCIQRNKALQVITLNINYKIHPLDLAQQIINIWISEMVAWLTDIMFMYLKILRDLRVRVSIGWHSHKTAKHLTDTNQIAIKYYMTQ